MEKEGRMVIGHWAADRGQSGDWTFGGGVWKFPHPNFAILGPLSPPVSSHRDFESSPLGACYAQKQSVYGFDRTCALHTFVRCNGGNIMRIPLTQAAISVQLDASLSILSGRVRGLQLRPLSAAVQWASGEVPPRRATLSRLPLPGYT